MSMSPRIRLAVSAREGSMNWETFAITIHVSVPGATGIHGLPCNKMNLKLDDVG